MAGNMYGPRWFQVGYSWSCQFTEKESLINFSSQKICIDLTSILCFKSIAYFHLFTKMCIDPSVFLYIDSENSVRINSRLND